MTTIVTRSGKGSRLTYTEGDTNFENLNSAKAEKSANLSDVNASSARTNLALESMALQDSTGISITGGTINGNSTLWFGQSITATKWVM